MGQMEGPPHATLGASGGVFGLLLAFGMAYPQRRIILLFPPIPMPAWLFVTLYGLLELTLGVTGTNEGVAHFAHLGGMAAGFVLLTLGWRQAALTAAVNPGPVATNRDRGRKMASKRAKVTKAAAEDAVRMLLRWAGEDPEREGLRETPRRVVSAFKDWYCGYGIDPREYLRRTFEETAGYDEMVVLRDIEFESHCEHHMAPIIGRAHVGYLPTDSVVGISKLARVVDVYARRFQVQEKMTSEIAPASRKCCSRAASAS